jgi:hypothetical protein
MKRKIIFFVAVITLLAQVAFGEPMNSNELQFLKYFEQSDLQSMEKILRENEFKIDLTALLFSILENYMPRGGEYSDRRNITPFNINTRLALPTMQLLVRYGANLNYGSAKNYSEPFYYYHYGTNSNTNIVFKRLAAGSSPLEYVIDDLEFDRQTKLSIVRFFLESGADIYKYYNGWYISNILRDDNISLLRVFIENGYNVNRGTYVDVGDEGYPLSLAVYKGQIATVRLLVESGAKVNQNDKNFGNKTPAQWAYENNQIDIYNYLKQNGATWTAPSQVASTPPPSTPPSSSPNNNNYTPPSSSSSSSSSGNSSSSSRSSGADIGKAIAEAFTPPLDSGTYGLSGTQKKIRLTGIAKSGMLTYTNQSGKTMSGYYNIDGNRMTVQADGYTYMYTITSKTSFYSSEYGENWVRTGF